jgi:hypothetical protein
MVGNDLFTGIDTSLVEGMMATRAGAFEGESATVYTQLATDAGIAADAVYAPQSYDAAFLLALAIEKNGSADREGLSAALREIASGPGEVIMPGEWEKAKETSTTKAPAVPSILTTRAMSTASSSNSPSPTARSPRSALSSNRFALLKSKGPDHRSGPFSLGAKIFSPNPASRPASGGFHRACWWCRASRWRS